MSWGSRGTSMGLQPQQQCAPRRGILWGFQLPQGFGIPIEHGAYIALPLDLHGDFQSALIGPSWDRHRAQGSVGPMEVPGAFEKNKECIYDNVYIYVTPVEAHFSGSNSQRCRSIISPAVVPGLNNFIILPEPEGSSFTVLVGEHVALSHRRYVSYSNPPLSPFPPRMHYCCCITCPLQEVYLRPCPGACSFRR